VGVWLSSPRALVAMQWRVAWLEAHGGLATNVRPSGLRTSAAERRHLGSPARQRWDTETRYRRQPRSGGTKPVSPLRG
jgi:hypothetical protein